MSRELDALVIRPDHTLCTICGEMEPIYVSKNGGTPAVSIISALQAMAERHAGFHYNDELLARALARKKGDAR